MKPSFVPFVNISDGRPSKAEPRRVRICGAPRVLSHAPYWQIAISYRAIAVGRYPCGAS